MLLHPNVQKRAQAELDSVVGRERLPTFADRAALPYVEAVVKETLRWQPVVPLGAHISLAWRPPLRDIVYVAVPHCAMFDGEYNGYHIPKGALLFGNAWCVLPNRFPLR